MQCDIHIGFFSNYVNVCADTDTTYLFIIENFVLSCK